MAIELQSAWVQVFGSVLAILIGFIIGRFFERRDRYRRRVVEASYSATPLVSPNNIGPLSVSLDKSHLSGLSADKGKPLAINTAYNLVITITNIGNEHIDDPEIDIVLDTSAHIVQSTLQSGYISPDKVAVKLLAGNTLRITPQYINSRETFSYSLISVNNKSPQCTLYVRAPGLIVQDPQISRRQNSYRIVVPTITLLVGLLLFLVFNVVSISVKTYHAEATIEAADTSIAALTETIRSANATVQSITQVALETALSEASTTQSLQSTTQSLQSTTQATYQTITAVANSIILTITPTPVPTPTLLPTP